MKIKLNKKGFTLIELLAVIVVLGIILVIAIPLVTGSINESKRGSFKASAEMILKEVVKQNVMATMPGNTSAIGVNASCTAAGSTVTVGGNNVCTLSGAGYTKTNLGLSEDYDITTSRVWWASNKLNVLLCATANKKFDNMGAQDTAGNDADDDTADCYLAVEQ